MSEPSHVDPRAARRALLADLEALRDSLSVAADAHVPILDDVVIDPDPAAADAPPPAAPSTGNRLQVERLFDERWRENTDRLVAQARARVASLRSAASAEPSDSLEADLVERVRARLKTDLEPALAEMIDAELDALRSALMYRLEEQVERLITRVLAAGAAPEADRWDGDTSS